MWTLALSSFMMKGHLTSPDPLQSHLALTGWAAHCEVDAESSQWGRGARQASARRCGAELPL